jgi:hypothetical protein
VPRDRNGTWPDDEPQERGGELDHTTTDGWTCHRINTGVVLSAEDQSYCRIEDSEEFRAQGFSPAGCASVYATSPTIYLASRA